MNDELETAIKAIIARIGSNTSTSASEYLHLSQSVVNLASAQTILIGNNRAPKPKE